MRRSVFASVTVSALWGPVVYFAAEATLQQKFLRDGRFSREATAEWLYQSVVVFPAVYLISVVLLCAALLASAGLRRLIGRQVEACGFAVGVSVALFFDLQTRLVWSDLVLGSLFVLLPAVTYARLRPA